MLHVTGTFARYAWIGAGGLNRKAPQGGNRGGLTITVDSRYALRPHWPVDVCTDGEGEQVTTDVREIY